MTSQETTGHYALVAVFETAQAVVAAAQRAHEAGYRRLEAFTPFPVEGLDEALGFAERWLPYVWVASGVVLAAGLWFLQWYSSVIDYPFVTGGKPYNSWPAWVIVIVATGLLATVLTAVLGMAALNGFPAPYHPIFNLQGYVRSGEDRFLLAIETDDPAFDAHQVRRFLEGLKPLEVVEVAN